MFNILVTPLLIALMLDLFLVNYGFLLADQSYPINQDVMHRVIGFPKAREDVSDVIIEKYSNAKENHHRYGT